MLLDNRFIFKKKGMFVYSGKVLLSNPTRIRVGLDVVENQGRRRRRLIIFRCVDVLFNIGTHWKISMIFIMYLKKEISKRELLYL